MKITNEDQQVSSKSKKRRIVLPQRTVRLRAPDCPVAHAGLSSAPGNSSPTASSRWHWWRQATRLFGVTSGLSSVKACSANDHLRCLIQRLGVLDRGIGLSGDPTRLPGVP
jgi:hypothetical protein